MQDFSLRLHEIMDELSTKLNTLSLLVAEEPSPLVSRYYQLPQATKEFEKQLKAEGRNYRDLDTIEVIQHYGSDATKLISSALSPSAMYGESEMSTRLLSKSVGVHAFKAFNGAPLIQDINSLKLSLKSLVQEYRTFNKVSDYLLFEWLHGHYPMLVTLYAYRKIPFFNEPIERLYFNWVVDFNTTLFTKDELIQFLIKRSEAAAKRIVTPGQTEDFYQRLADDVRKRKEGFYRQRRVKPARPQCVAYSESGAKSSFNASLPAMLLANKREPRITDLTDYHAKRDKAHQRSTRRGVLKHGELVIPELEIYTAED